MHGLRRNDPAVAQIVHAWRELTGKVAASTVVGCSGGADSTALLLALHAAVGPEPLVAVHVVHDMRPEVEALADRDAVQQLAEALGVVFVEQHVAIGDGNAEAAARTKRYAALGAIAQQQGASFVATAHHADDQLETMLMALLRGAGPRGLAGMAPVRPLANGVQLVRPMLCVTHADAERLCAEAGVTPCEDATNTDTTRVRAAIRAHIAPELERLRPGAAVRVAHNADLVRTAADLLECESRRVFGAGYEWPRELLRPQPAAIVSEGLRAAALRLTNGLGADSLSQRRLEQAVRAVRDTSTDPRVFAWPSGIELRVTAQHVALTQMECS